MTYATKTEEKIGFSAPAVANQSGHASEGIEEEVFPSAREG